MIIIGKIGAGKTSLLQAILNEMTYVPSDEMERYGGMYANVTDKEVNQIRKDIYSPEARFEGGAPIKIAGRVAYVEQQAWI